MVKTLITITEPKLRQAFKKKSIKTIFISVSNLKLLFCRNKTKLFTNSCLGVYEFKCTCNSAYFGETKKNILTRTINTNKIASRENETILEQQNTL